MVRALVLAALAAALGPALAAVPLIIDTDQCLDVDDVLAEGVAHALVDEGEVDLLAVIANVGYPRTIGASSVIAHWYNHDSVVLGSFKGEFGKTKAGDYIDDLVSHWPSPIRNSSQVDDAVATYRHVLAKAEDASVVISSIGFLQNIAGLLRSPPDSTSPLNGTELVERKVRLLAVMGGYYPKSPGGIVGEFNLACGAGMEGPDDECAGQSRQAITVMWPPSVRMVFSGFQVGDKVHTGAPMTDCAPDGNPVRRALIDHVGLGNSRLSWDPLTTLFAVRGASAVGVHEAGFGGWNNVSTKGANDYIPGSASNQSYLVLDNPDTATNAINDLLCKPPKTRAPPSSPVDPDAPWTETAGANCYGQRGMDPATHGAVDLEMPPSADCGVMPLAACKSVCDKTDRCDGVVTADAGGGNVHCYRKADIDISQCDHGTSFSTYVRGA